MGKFKKGDSVIAIELSPLTEPNRLMTEAFEKRAVMEILESTNDRRYKCRSDFFDKKDCRGYYYYHEDDLKLYDGRKDYSSVNLVTHNMDKDFSTLIDIEEVTGHVYVEDYDDHREIVKFIKRHQVEYMRKKDENSSKKEIKPTKTQTEKGNTIMSNIQSIVGQFGEVTNGNFKLSMQGIAIRTAKGYAIYDKENGRMIDVMDFVTDADGMLFQMPTQITGLKENDIILINDKPAFVKSINVEEKSVLALDPATSNEITHKFSGNLFGLEFVTKITTIFEAMGGANPLAPAEGAAAGGMNPLLMMTLLGKDKGDSKMKDLLPLLMMQGGAGGNPQMQQMLPFLLMKDGGSSNMMEMMMLGQLMGGGQSPFAFMQPAQPASTPAE